MRDNYARTANESIRDKEEDFLERGTKWMVTHLLSAAWRYSGGVFCYTVFVFVWQYNCRKKRMRGIRWLKRRRKLHLFDFWVFGASVAAAAADITLLAMNDAERHRKCRA